MNSETLAGEMTIYQAEKMMTVFRDALEVGKLTQAPVSVNLAAVTECDGAGLQALLSLARSAAAAGLEVNLDNVPAVIAALLGTYGVANHFAIHPQGAAS